MNFIRKIIAKKRMQEHLEEARRYIRDWYEKPEPSGIPDIRFSFAPSKPRTQADIERYLREGKLYEEERKRRQEAKDLARQMMENGLGFADSEPDWSGAQFSIPEVPLPPPPKAETKKTDEFWEMVREEYAVWEKMRRRHESFSAFILKKMKQLEMDSVEFYNRAGIDRKLFSKLKTDFCYQPSRTTAIRCCLALKLNQQEADELLRYAGFALSPSSSFDLAIKYCIAHQIYNLMDVNTLLEMLSEPCL